MAIVLCERCGSDDIERDATTPSSAGEVAVHCLSCDHRFTRTPAVVCSRCGSGDVETGVVDGWAFDDIEEARDDPKHADWSYVDRQVHRCRKCNQRWQTVDSTRPYVPPPGGDR